MTDYTQYVLGSANAAQFCQSWSAHVDALERHLSAKMWALAGVVAVLTTYAIGRILLPVALHALVPDLIRTVLNLI